MLNKDPDQKDKNRAKYAKMLLDRFIADQPENNFDKIFGSTSTVVAAAQIAALQGADVPDLERLLHNPGSTVQRTIYPASGPGGGLHAAMRSDSPSASVTSQKAPHAVSVLKHHQAQSQSQQQQHSSSKSSSLLKSISIPTSSASASASTEASSSGGGGKKKRALIWEPEQNRDKYDEEGNLLPGQERNFFAKENEIRASTAKLSDEELFQVLISSALHFNSAVDDNTNNNVGGSSSSSAVGEQQQNYSPCVTLDDDAKAEHKPISRKSSVVIHDVDHESTSSKQQQQHQQSGKHQPSPEKELHVSDRIDQKVSEAFRNVGPSLAKQQELILKQKLLEQQKQQQNQRQQQQQPIASLTQLQQQYGTHQNNYSASGSSNNLLGESLSPAASVAANCGSLRASPTAPFPNSSPGSTNAIPQQQGETSQQQQQEEGGSPNLNETRNSNNNNNNNKSMIEVLPTSSQNSPTASLNVSPTSAALQHQQQQQPQPQNQASSPTGANAFSALSILSNLNNFTSHHANTRLPSHECVDLLEANFPQLKVSNAINQAIVCDEHVEDLHFQLVGEQMGDDPPDANRGTLTMKEAEDLLFTNEDAALDLFLFLGAYDPVSTKYPLTMPEGIDGLDTRLKLRQRLAVLNSRFDSLQQAVSDLMVEQSAIDREVEERAFADYKVFAAKRKKQQMRGGGGGGGGGQQKSRVGDEEDDDGDGDASSANPSSPSSAAAKRRKRLLRLQQQAEEQQGIPFRMHGSPATLSLSVQSLVLPITRLCEFEIIPWIAMDVYVSIIFPNMADLGFIAMYSKDPPLIDLEMFSSLLSVHRLVMKRREKQVIAIRRMPIGPQPHTPWMPLVQRKVVKNMIHSAHSSRMGGRSGRSQSVLSSGSGLSQSMNASTTSGALGVDRTTTSSNLLTASGRTGSSSTTSHPLGSQHSQQQHHHHLSVPNVAAVGGSSGGRLHRSGSVYSTHSHDTTTGGDHTTEGGGTNSQGESTSATPATHREYLSLPLDDAAETEQSYADFLDADEDENLNAAIEKSQALHDEIGRVDFNARPFPDPPPHLVGVAAHWPSNAPRSRLQQWKAKMKQVESRHTEDPRKRTTALSHQKLPLYDEDHFDEPIYKGPEEISDQYAEILESAGPAPFAVRKLDRDITTNVARFDRIQPSSAKQWKSRDRVDATSLVEPGGIRPLKPVHNLRSGLYWFCAAKKEEKITNEIADLVQKQAARNELGIWEEEEERDEEEEEEEKNKKKKNKKKSKGKKFDSDEEEEEEESENDEKENKEEDGEKSPEPSSPADSTSFFAGAGGADREGSGSLSSQTIVFAETAQEKAERERRERSVRRELDGHYYSLEPTKKEQIKEAKRKLINHVANVKPPFVAIAKPFTACQPPPLPTSNPRPVDDDDDDDDYDKNDQNYYQDQQQQQRQQQGRTTTTTPNGSRMRRRPYTASTPKTAQDALLEYEKHMQEQRQWRARPATARKPVPPPVYVSKKGVASSTSNNNNNNTSRSASAVSRSPRSSSPRSARPESHHYRSETNTKNPLAEMMNNSEYADNDNFIQNDDEGDDVFDEEFSSVNNNNQGKRRTATATTRAPSSGTARRGTSPVTQQFTSGVMNQNSSSNNNQNSSGNNQNTSAKPMRPAPPCRPASSQKQQFTLPHQHQNQSDPQQQQQQQHTYVGFSKLTRPTSAISLAPSTIHSTCSTTRKVIDFLQTTEFPVKIRGNSPPVRHQSPSPPSSGAHAANHHQPSSHYQYQRQQQQQYQKQQKSYSPNEAAVPNAAGDDSISLVSSAANTNATRMSNNKMKSLRAEFGAEADIPSLTKDQTASFRHLLREAKKEAETRVKIQREFDEIRKVESKEEVTDEQWHEKVMNFYRRDFGAARMKGSPGRKRSPLQ